MSSPIARFSPFTSLKLESSSIALPMYVHGYLPFLKTEEKKSPQRTISIYHFSTE